MILLVTVVENKNHSPVEACETGSDTLVTIHGNKNRSPVEAGETDSDKQVTVVRHLLTDANRWNQQW